MRPEEKRKLREQAAVKLVENEITLDSKLLRRQIASLSSMISITNEEISNNLTGAIMILEIFEWLPKGEYIIKFKVV